MQTELPKGWKILKFTKFAGDTSEYIVKYTAIYQIEANDLTNKENLRMKYLSNSLNNNVFTWFTILTPSSMHYWNQIKRVFYEQIYIGLSKISLKKLASVKQKSSELINDYLNWLRMMKLRCFTQIPEHVD